MKVGVRRSVFEEKGVESERHSPQFGKSAGPGQQLHHMVKTSSAGPTSLKIELLEQMARWIFPHTASEKLIDDVLLLA